VTDDQHSEQPLSEILKELTPFRISGVVVQKNDSSRVSIFVDGKFLFGIALFDAHELGLHKGAEVVASMIDPICAAIEFDHIQSHLLRMLAKRPYPRNLLHRKLSTKGFSRPSIQKVLDYFDQKGWIDDHVYATAFAKDKFRLAGWGPQKISMYLKRDGVSELIIQEVVQQLEPENGIESLLLSLVHKRKQHFLREKDTFKRKKKVVDYLLRKGFNQSDVFRHIDTMLKQVTE